MPQLAGLQRAVLALALAAAAAVAQAEEDCARMMAGAAQVTATELVTGGAPVHGSDVIMMPKAHGTSAAPVMEQLRWGCDRELADRICNFNRHYAESSGYFLKTTFLQDAVGGEIIFRDSNTGKPLFVAPRGRSWEDFIAESRKHGWPSFRDQEVVALELKQQQQQPTRRRKKKKE